MTWNVKEDFCGEVATYSPNNPNVHSICPSVRVETSRELTADERRRVIDAIVKAASVEMIHINEEDEND